MPRPKKPKELKLLQGTFRPSREPSNTPEYHESDDYPAPDTLDGLALLTWERLVPLMTEAGVLRDTDLIALEQYCQVYEAWREATEKVLRQGSVLETEIFTKSGDTYIQHSKNPAVTAMKEHSTELRGLSGLLGLDPSSRGKINVKKEDDKAKTFGGLRPATG